VLTTESGEERVYDHVVMACHADETLRILGDDATQSEKEILGGFEFSSNSAVLHGDKRLMPVRRKAWSAWNYLTSSTSTPDGKTKANVNSVSLYVLLTLFSLRLLPPVSYSRSISYRLDPSLSLYLLSSPAELTT
jgi:predicted NAD/FAD-binding protein